MPYTTKVELPSNSDADKVLSTHATSAVNNDDEMLNEVNKHYFTLVNEEGANKWYIAACTEVNQDAERSFAPRQQTL